ncbi:MAG: hypothetical protein ABFS35_02630 [Bacteroidota bacterium]
MRKLLIGLFVVFAIGANAQTEEGNVQIETGNAHITKGKIFVGGALGFNTSGGSASRINGGTTTETEGVSTFGFRIIPKLGYMVTENIGVGIGIGYDYSKTITPDFFDNGFAQFEQVEKAGTLVASPFARYYKSLADKFYLFGELSLPVRFASEKELMWNATFDGTTDYDGEISSMSFGANLGLGANYFVSDKVALEARFNIFGINYISTKYTNLDSNGDGSITKYSGFGMNANSDNLLNFSSLAIGIKVFL